MIHTIERLDPEEEVQLTPSATRAALRAFQILEDLGSSGAVLTALMRSSNHPEALGLPPSDAQAVERWTLDAAELAIQLRTEAI